LEYNQRRAKAGDLARITFEGYRDRLKSFPPELGDELVSAIRPESIRAWVAREGWGPTRSHDCAATVKSAFRWARRERLIQNDPLDPLVLPRRKIRRETIPTQDEIETFLNSVRDHRFRILVEFILSTGCRPGEASRLEASMFDRARGVLILRGKTTHKTGLQRQIVVSPEWLPRIAALCEIYPTGPLFRNEDGVAWSRNAIGQAFRRVRARAGLGSSVVAYALRHRRVTDLLQQGTSLSVVSAIAGHASAAFTSRVYAHLDQEIELMRSALGQQKKTPR
jgi:integrase